MNSHIKEILGSVLSVIGTVEAAIGSTPFQQLSKETKFNLSLQGNVLQAAGASLSADGQGSLSLELIGDEIQAIGNSTVVVGLLIQFNDIVNQKLIITGNWLQALGSFVGLTDEFFDSTPSGRALNIAGGLLQGIGNSMQALGGTDQLYNNNDEYGQFLGVSGSWIQAIGSVLSLIGQIKEETEEIQLGINE
ncbi:uncharacterized protein DUF6944 [Cytobacillus horneckiae]|uniref:Uncharacterized protein n=1 Tax=Cytobacillus horneckiae TaxID=549687 RepID=A0A2N0ZE14_9BACI|nr:hypothetical protein [Cytobacillus horneckiae]NRG46799.1 hypothetical protein [Bacillus sp. CRN 9]MBN6888981.1 hypothetical protein [Cytobacillus horneckiae]MCM3180830.1 hypothetical protein [Cytobacillus horneckiae]MEC1157462.1 hypothetical protein [Cytobacillus horneckiae]MED2939411.1 hypothetical protein [Cytobacillus horneckiae]